MQKLYKTLSSGGRRGALLMTLAVITLASTVASQDRPLEFTRQGAEIILQDGRYANVRLEIQAGQGGTAAKPLIIRPQSPGGVRLTGRSQFIVNANHVVISGLIFDHVRHEAVLIAGDNNRLEKSTFINSGNPSNTKSRIVIIGPTGQDNTIADNRFTGSISMSVSVRDGPAAAVEHPTNNKILRNRFENIPRLSNNGQEPIQIAGPGGGAGYVNLNTLIEGNIFDRAEGDREAISAKAPGSIIRGNTFRNMDAAINLRGGRDNIVERNVLINTRRIRVAGSNNRIVNNFIIYPRRGIAFQLSADTKIYEPAVGNIIAHNTIITRKVGILVGYPGGKDDSNYPVLGPPRDNVIADNIITLDDPQYFVRIAAKENAALAARISNNVVWSSKFPERKLSPKLTADGNIVADPKLRWNGVIGTPTEGSAAIGYAKSGLAKVDYFKKPRTGRSDAGAVQFSQ